MQKTEVPEPFLFCERFKHLCFHLNAITYRTKTVMASNLLKAFEFSGSLYVLNVTESDVYVTKQRIKENQNQNRDVLCT